MSKTDSGGTTSYKRAGAYVTDSLLKSTVSSTTTDYTPGVSSYDGTTNRFLHSGIENADTQTDDGGDVSAMRRYDAFGNPVAAWGGWWGPFGYGGPYGYQTDPDHGLMLLGHRYYEADTGRFLTRDPIKDGRNWYGYCDGSSLSWADPTGLLTIAGDTRGLAAPAWLAPGNWSSHHGLSKERVIQLLIETKDDSVGIWGHGDSGRIFVNNKEYLTRWDLEHIKRERERLGRKKFKSFVVNQCEIFKDGDLLNAALGISHSVSGYTDLTSHQLRQTWTEPVTPGSTLGSGPGKKRKKPGAVWGKPGSRG